MDSIPCHPLLHARLSCSRYAGCTAPLLLSQAARTSSPHCPCSSAAPTPTSSATLRYRRRRDRGIPRTTTASTSYRGEPVATRDSYFAGGLRANRFVGFGGASQVRLLEFAMPISPSLPFPLQQWCYAHTWVPVMFLLWMLTTRKQAMLPLPKHRLNCSPSPLDLSSPQMARTKAYLHERRRDITPTARGLTW